FNLAKAKNFAQLDHSDTKTFGSLQCLDLPIDFLSLNPLDVSVVGLVNLEAKINESNKKIRGECHATVDNVEVSALGYNNKMGANGKFDALFTERHLALQGQLNVREK